MATVLIGRCLPYGDGITFWPVVELVRAAGGADAVERALADDEDAAAALLGLLEPERRRRRRATRSSGPCGACFETLAAERPLVVCVEDIHWAEPTFLDLLEYLAGLVRRRACGRALPRAAGAARSCGRPG